MNRKETKKRLLEEFAKTPVVQVACQKVGVGRTSYYRLRKEDKRFARLADEAIAEGRLVMNDLGEVTVISRMNNQQDLHAAKFWLAHNHPRYSPKLELSGRVTSVIEELSPDQKKLLKQAVRLALPQDDYGQEETGSGGDAPADGEGSEL